MRDVENGCRYKGNKNFRIAEMSVRQQTSGPLCVTGRERALEIHRGSEKIPGKGQ